MPTGFVPPPYPYDRLSGVIKKASAHRSVIDLSIGVPCDPPPADVLAAFRDAEATRQYPASIGSAALREAASDWMKNRLGVADTGSIAACVGTKEFVATLPQLLKLRDPSRDTILYPAIAYPTYEMGATLGGCRAVAVPLTDTWEMDLGSIVQSDIDRSLCLWVNSPANPTGACLDLASMGEWGRTHGVPVFSDECYVEFTFGVEPETILSAGPAGVVAVHSLSKRSNFAGGRIGFYAGDAEIVHYLSETRKHMGLMASGPSQAAAVVALGDQSHVDAQREMYRGRLERLISIFGQLGIEAVMPQGAFYLWVAAPQGDAWALADLLAERLGMVVSPGEFYGSQGAGYVRVAAVQPDDALDELESRLS